jgi:mannose-6-phosphate isomerase-like protein (cupin superfamily)
VSSEEENPYIEGRRTFLKWRDLGMREVTNGFMRADIFTKVPGDFPGTGWHYHPKGGQFFYVLEGWVELEFEDGKLYRFKKGDAGWIPGGMRHCAMRMSDDHKSLELSFPSEIETVNCERPAHFPKELPRA